MKASTHYSFSSFISVNHLNQRRNPTTTLKFLYRNSVNSRILCSLAEKHLETKGREEVGVKKFPPWFSIAPMMDWTDNHYRTLARLISKHSWLYTEMVVAETIVHQKDNLDRFLAFPPEQHPIVLQLGGSNLGNLAKATELANTYGYDEINLNCGCPSGKVAGHGCFGVQLMLNPKFVADAMSVIAENCSVPVSVKCRIGVDNRDSYRELCDFIHTVASHSPTRHFILHSRKALLNGISPEQNRKIPPLKYEYYFGLVRDFPELQFTINGGITGINEVNAARVQGAHGVMIGRAAYNDPWHTLGPVDNTVYGAQNNGISRRQILEKFQVYADSILGKYGPNKPSLRQVVKPLLNLFHSEPGNGLWKRQADSAFCDCTCVSLLLWLEERYETVYMRHPGFQKGTKSLLTLDNPFPLDLPENLIGEKWAFVQLPFSAVQEEISVFEKRFAFGKSLDLDLLGIDLDGKTLIPGLAVASSRAVPLAAWMNGLELSSVEADINAASLILSVGVSTRYVYAKYKKSPATTQEAEAWEAAKKACGGLHFLAIQENLDSDDCVGFWLLLDLPPPTV